MIEPITPEEVIRYKGRALSESMTGALNFQIRHHFKDGQSRFSYGVTDSLLSQIQESYTRWRVEYDPVSCELIFTPRTLPCLASS